MSAVPQQRTCVERAALSASSVSLTGFAIIGVAMIGTAPPACCSRGSAPSPPSPPAVRPSSFSHVSAIRLTDVLSSAGGKVTATILQAGIG